MTPARLRRRVLALLGATFLLPRVVRASATLPGTELHEAERMLDVGDPERAEAIAAETLADLDVAFVDLRYQAIMIRARSALVRRDAVRAQALFAQAAEGYGERPEAELGRIESTLLAGDFAQAMSWSELVVGEHPDYPEGYALAAYVDDRAGNATAAQERLKMARARWPDHAGLLAAYAEIAIDRGNAARAAADLDAWTKDHADHGDVLRLRARAARALGDRTADASLRERAARAYRAAGQIRLAALVGRALPTSAVSADRRTETAPVDDVKGAVKVATGMWPSAPFEDWPPAGDKAVQFGNGLVLAGGRRVVIAAEVGARVGTTVFVRNGSGSLRRGTVATRDEGLSLAIVELAESFPAGLGYALADAVTARTGAFCFGFGFPVVEGLDASYPVIAAGVIATRSVGPREFVRSTVTCLRDQRGVPIFDAGGHLVGIHIGNAADIPDVRDAGFNSGACAATATVLAKFAGIAVEPAAARPSAGRPRTVQESWQALAPVVVAVVAV